MLAGILLSFRALLSAAGRSSGRKGEPPPMSPMPAISRKSPLLLCSLLLASAPAFATHHCFPTTIQCGETKKAALDATECFVDEQSWADLYTFAGPSGQTVTLTMTSTSFNPSILL